MREIKFRVWNTKKGEFEYPDIIGFHSESFSWTHSRRYFHNCQEWDNEDGFISNPVLEQFTGLHDKNGVEIYEGDILSKVSISELGSLIQYFYLVFWSSSDQGFKTKQYVLDENNEGLYWRIKNEGVFDSLVMAKTYNHVIGNIYQNPELIK